MVITSLLHINIADHLLTILAKYCNIIQQITYQESLQKAFLLHMVDCKKNNETCRWLTLNIAEWFGKNCL